MGCLPPAVVEAAASPDLGTSVTVLTYQALAVLDRPDADGDEADPAATAATEAGRTAHDRRRERVLVARGGIARRSRPPPRQRRAIVARLAALGPVTLVLDECHHLLALWGHAGGDRRELHLTRRSG
jgi:hypothetical protein